MGFGLLAYGCSREPAAEEAIVPRKERVIRTAQVRPGATGADVAADSQRSMARLGEKQRDPNRRRVLKRSLRLPLHARGLLATYAATHATRIATASAPWAARKASESPVLSRAQTAEPSEVQPKVAAAPERKAEPPEVEAAPERSPEPAEPRPEPVAQVSAPPATREDPPAPAVVSASVVPPQPKVEAQPAAPKPAVAAVPRAPAPPAEPAKPPEPAKPAEPEPAPVAAAEPEPVPTPARVATASAKPQPPPAAKPEPEPAAAPSPPPPEAKPTDPERVVLIAPTKPSDPPSVETAAAPPDADPPEAPRPQPKPEERKKRPTPMSPQDATHLLAWAWERVAGEDPTAEVISVFWAQWALETGRGRWMVDYNFAGLKGKAPDGGWAHWWTWEETKSGPRRVRAKFRNYATGEDGAFDYVDMLYRRYPRAVAAARRGEAANFILELEQGGFFTEIPKHYMRSVISLAREFRREQRAARF